MPDKYKKTAIGFQRTDNQPLEANVYFESMSEAGPYISLNPTSYPGQRIFVRNSYTGEYDEYQNVDNRPVRVHEVRTISVFDLLKLPDAPSGSSFGNCFGVASGVELHKRLQGVMVIVDTTDDETTTSISCKYTSSTTTGTLNISFIKGGITFVYDAQFDVSESGGLSHFAFKRIQTKIDLNLEVRVLSSNGVHVRFCPSVPLNTYLVVRRKIKKSSKRRKSSRPNQISRNPYRHYSLRGVYHGCLKDRTNAGFIISVADLLKTESIDPGWYSVDIEKLANWAFINSGFTEGHFLGQTTDYVYSEYPKLVYSKFGLQLITLDENYLDGLGVANKNPCLYMGNMVRMKYRMWVVNASNPDIEERYVSCAVAVD